MVLQLIMETLLIVFECTIVNLAATYRQFTNAAWDWIIIKIIIIIIIIIIITSNSWHYSCPRSVDSILAPCVALWNIPIHNEDVHTYSIQ